MGTADRISNLQEEVEVTLDLRETRPAQFLERPTVRGKFLFVGDEKFYVKGVTYGTFRPDPDSGDFPDRKTVELDFLWMSVAGINTIRTYTVPPRWLLDAAMSHGLRVMVGLPWEQHIAFLDDRKRRRDIERRVREGVRACAGHPAILCFAIGNEIPAGIVRWHGRGRVERFLNRLCVAAREEDPAALFTYVSYPTTEYLELPFVDLACFNVYLESEAHLDSYLARLHNVAGECPLILTELGLDGRRNGEMNQAKAIEWQIRTSFASGCAGTFVFAWTDEWHRGGHDVEDWEFGLTTRDRHPKPALAAVRSAYAEAPFPDGMPWPRISVVVCSHNGASTLEECLDKTRQLRYPDYEVVLVDDGSTDATAQIGRSFSRVRVIKTEHKGLSNARNVGLEAATGEIVAYLDDDAYPDPDWLTYLAASFIAGDYVAIGGPNIPPPGDGAIASCVANAPGGPVHVLLSDREAEHIPGCNMAFRRKALLEIGGFDTQFWAAGDDVDVCWRLQERGWKLGFSPAAVVWHHRRNSVRAFWRQQRGYGRAEALLERKWPHKYNDIGHLSWSGRIYGNGHGGGRLFRRQRVYQGVWGTAPFQFVTPEGPGAVGSAIAMPEWYLVIFVLSVLSAVGLLWPRLLLAVPLLGLALLAPAVHSLAAAARARFDEYGDSLIRRVGLRALTGLLHLGQPLARLWGRLSYGLTPWRHHTRAGMALPIPSRGEIWSEEWRASDDWLRSIEDTARGSGAPVIHGDAHERWDLEVRGGALGGVRLRIGIEEHGMGRQLVRFRSRPAPARASLWWLLLFGGLSIMAARSGAVSTALVLGGLSMIPALVSLKQMAAAAGALRHALRKERRWG